MTDRDIYDDNGNRYPAQKGPLKPLVGDGFTQSFKATVARYDDLPAGKKADYERAQKRQEPTPRQRLAEAIQAAEDKPHGVWRPLPVALAIEDARAILAALQEADWREMQGTLDGDGMP